MNHTKGEWKVNRLGHGIIDCGDKQVVCVTQLQNKEEAEANCSLISAAPDMYEALKAVMACLPGGFDKGRKALAKARGENNNGLPGV